MSEMAILRTVVSLPPRPEPVQFGTLPFWGCFRVLPGDVDILARLKPEEGDESIAVYVTDESATVIHIHPETLVYRVRGTAVLTITED